MVSKACVGAAVCFLVYSLSSLAARQVEFYFTNRIVPDVISAPPPETVSVLFKGGAMVESCNEIDPKELKDTPIYFSWEYREGVKYTLLMLDPDFPSRLAPNILKWPLLQMLVLNITANDVYGPDTVTVRSYLPPTTPFPASALHRYVFLVYEQTPDTSAETCADNMRLPVLIGFGFELDSFVKAYSLVGPIAGNCFLA